MLPICARLCYDKGNKHRKGERSMDTLERNKQFVAEFYDIIINQKDYEKA